MAAKELIATVTVGSGGAASIDFTSIPQTYTDLQIVFNLRSTNSATYAASYFTVNNTALSERNLVTDNGSVGTWSGTSNRLDIPAATNTSDTFSNTQIYIADYASTTKNKAISVEDTFESNGSYFQIGIWAVKYASTSAVTSVKYAPATGSLAQYSTASLYGWTKGSGGAIVA